MRKTIKPVAFIFLLSLLPAVLFAIKGYAGDDFYFHLPSWMELRDTWLSGSLWSGWAFKANYKLGDPHFSFYPPFSLGLGAALAILMPLRFVPAVYMALISFLSGASMYVAAKHFLNQQERLPAAILYMLSPYLVMSELIHFTIAELLVQAWIPLVLLLFFQVAWEQRTRIVLLACLLGLSWLTDVPASIVLLYGLGILALCFAWEQKSFKPLLSFIVAEAIAGMLAAFYLLPVFMEQGWINTGGLLLRFRPSQFVVFLPGQWAAEGKIPSWVLDEWAQGALSILVIAVCIIRRRQWMKEGPQVRFWVYLTLVTIFFFVPLSLPLWAWLPEMHAVQFPFRFLPFVGVAVPMVLFAKGTPAVLRKPSWILMLLLTVVPIQRFLRGTPITLLGKDSFGPMEAELEHRGYFSPPEYGHVSNTGFGLHPGAEATGVLPEQLCSIAPPALQTARVEFSTDTSRPCTLVFSVYSYPYWRAVTESGTVLATASNAKGLLAVAVPAGRHKLQVFFKPASRVRTVTAFVSLGALVWVALVLIYTAVLRLRRSQDEHQLSASAEVTFAGSR